MSKQERYCVKCNDISPYKVASEIVRTSRKGIDFEYLCSVGICEKCGDLVYVPELHDINVERREEAYFKAKEFHDSIINNVMEEED